MKCEYVYISIAVTKGEKGGKDGWKRAKQKIYRPIQRICRFRRLRRYIVTWGKWEAIHHYPENRFSTCAWERNESITDRGAITSHVMKYLPRVQMCLKKRRYILSMPFCMLYHKYCSQNVRHKNCQHKISGRSARTEWSSSISTFKISLL